MLILAAVAINLTIGNNGIFTRAEDASEINLIAKIKEEFEFYKAENSIDEYLTGKENVINAEGYEELKKYMPSITEKYADMLKVEDNELVYKSTVEEEMAKRFESLGIKMETAIGKEEWYAYEEISGGIRITGFKEEFMEAYEQTQNQLTQKIIEENPELMEQAQSEDEAIAVEAMNKLNKLLLDEVDKNYPGLGNIPNTIEGKTVLEIGEGAFSFGAGYNEDYFTCFQNAKIPNTVTTIGAEAFRNNQLTSVEIPDSVTTIGAMAFRSNKLTSVEIPDSVTTIEEDTFGNNQLTSVEIPDSVTTIRQMAFNYNELTSVEIPDSVTSIENLAFAKNQLESVKLSNSITTIGLGAFENNQLTSVEIPDSVTTIGNSAFFQNQLTSVEIPDSVTTIGGQAFSNNQLTSVEIPDSVTTIGGQAFSNNQLTSVEIPNSEIYIDHEAFSNNRLKTITIPSNVERLESCLGIFSYNDLESVIFEGTPTISRGQLLGIEGMFYGNEKLTANTIKVPAGSLDYFKSISLDYLGLSSYDAFYEG